MVIAYTIHKIRENVLTFRIYGPHTTKFVVYASIVTALHESIDLKQRSPWIRLDPLILSLQTIQKHVFASSISIKKIKKNTRLCHSQANVGYFVFAS